MVGLILGAVLVVGVAKMLRRRARYRAFGCGYGAYGGYGGHACYGGHRGFDDGPDFDGMGSGPASGPGLWNLRRQGARWPFRALFERLETTPGQERAIFAALEELRQNRESVRDELRQTRADIARALEGGLIEDSTLEEAFARQDRLFARLRVSFTEALKKVTEALDEPQRKRLASWIERGFFRGARPFFADGRGGWGGGSVWA
jgi:hypothetical protein